MAPHNHSTRKKGSSGSNNLKGWCDRVTQLCHRSPNQRCDDGFSTCRLTISPPSTNVHLALPIEKILKERSRRGGREHAVIQARAQRRALRLDHAHALSAQLQPRMPPVRCPHRSASRPLNRFCSGSLNAAKWHGPLHRSSCEKWPRISCAGHRLRPQPHLGLCSRHSPWLCPPSQHSNELFTWQGLLARLRRTESPGGTASAIVGGRCPAGACAFQPRPDTSRLAYFPTAGRRRQ